MVVGDEVEELRSQSAGWDICVGVDFTQDDGGLGCMQLSREPGAQALQEWAGTTRAPTGRSQQGRGLGSRAAGMCLHGAGFLQEAGGRRVWKQQKGQEGNQPHLQFTGHEKDDSLHGEGRRKPGWGSAGWAC